jgi:hypothetical protein
LLLVYTPANVGCGFFPYFSVIVPFETGDGRRPLLASNFFPATAPSDDIGMVSLFILSGSFFFSTGITGFLLSFFSLANFFLSFSCAAAISFCITALIRCLKPSFFRCSSFNCRNNFCYSAFKLL